MSQHDFDIANQTMPPARTDVTAAIKALASKSSGTSPPAAPLQYQDWLDTSVEPWIWKMWDGGNWIPLFSVAPATDSAIAFAGTLPASPQTFPVGTKLLFPQATAPTGWTQDIDANDRVMRVVNGATGGQTGGSWTISGISVSITPTQLTIAQMPSHAHAVGPNVGPFGGFFIGVGQGGGASGNTTSFDGGNQAHGHGATPLADGNWRPSYLDVIKATKV